MNQTAKIKPPEHDNVFVDLLANLVIPTFILSKFSDATSLGPKRALLIALAFPLFYLAYKLIKSRRVSFLAIIGLASVLATGGLGLFELDGFWFAVKEASIPLIIGIVTFISSKMKHPLVRTFLYNDKVFDLDNINAALAKNESQAAFEDLLKRATIWISFSFLLSAILNFGLAIYILKSPAGTPEFNSELAKMNMLSLPVITVPSFIVMALALYQLMKRLSVLTGIPTNDLLKSK